MVFGNKPFQLESYRTKLMEQELSSHVQDPVSKDLQHSLYFDECSLVIVWSFTAVVNGCAGDDDYRLIFLPI